MTEYDDTNRGSVWRNEDKTADNPTWADFKGSLNVNGVEYWVSMWKRKPDANPKAPPLSFTIKEKETKQPRVYVESQSGTVEKPQTPADDGFDDIPF